MQSSTKILTPARLAIWDALKGWQKWTKPPATFAADDHEVHYFLQQEPNTGRCPFVAVSWQPFNPAWETHLMQRWPSLLFLSIWVPTRELTLSEQLLEDALDAVFRFPHANSTDAAPVAHVQQTLALIGGQHPEIAGMEVGQAERRGQEGQHHLLRSSVALNLRLQKDPLRRAS